MSTVPASTAPGDTIAAIATPAGRGGVGIVRVSGPASAAIARALCGRLPSARHAQHARFRAPDGELIDSGLVLWFAGPASFTGEDVLELQAHGSPVLLQRLLRAVCALGARPALPGEFSQRAFQNGRLDLAQAEAVADLIAAGSETAARAAVRALDGAFSQPVQALAQRVTRLRVHLEAALDFPEEEIDFLADPALLDGIVAAQQALHALLQTARRGQRLRDGLHVVLAGPPNAGKSSLLNRLAGAERAIVTDIAGTTRDVLRETVAFGGIEFQLADTAGLRDTDDPVEREGLRRAQAELQRADLALVLLDARAPAPDAALRDALQGVPRVLWLLNKIDLLDAAARARLPQTPDHIALSVRSGEGLDALERALLDAAGLSDAADGAFSARARHVMALERAEAHLDAAAGALRSRRTPELAAEDLRAAHDALGDIVGRTTPDALLGEIFSSFCIGK